MQYWRGWNITRPLPPFTSGETTNRSDLYHFTNSHGWQKYALFGFSLGTRLFPCRQFIVFLGSARGSQRVVVHHGWPLTPSYMSPNAGGWGCGCGLGGVPANEYRCAHGAQINFGDLTPYWTMNLWGLHSRAAFSARRVTKLINHSSLWLYYLKKILIND